MSRVPTTTNRRLAGELGRHGLADLDGDVGREPLPAVDHLVDDLVQGVANPSRLRDGLADCGTGTGGIGREERRARIVQDQVGLRCEPGLLVVDRGVCVELGALQRLGEFSLVHVVEIPQQSLMVSFR